MKCPEEQTPEALQPLCPCLPQHSLIFCPGSGFQVPRLAVHFCCPLGGVAMLSPFTLLLSPGEPALPDSSRAATTPGL